MRDGGGSSIGPRANSCLLWNDVQLDGAHHDRFEQRRANAASMVMLNDATNEVWAQFFEEETTRASSNVFER